MNSLEHGARVPRLECFLAAPTPAKIAILCALAASIWFWAVVIQKVMSARQARASKVRDSK